MRTRIFQVVVNEAGVAGGPGARDQAPTGGPQYFSGVDTVKIRSMDATAIAGDYHDHKIVNITNMGGPSIRGVAPSPLEPPPDANPSHELVNTLKKRERLSLATEPESDH